MSPATLGTGASIQRGAFIVLEGLDRAGKTTQVQLLAEALEAAGRKTQRVRFPDRTTPIGQMINAYVTNQADMDDHAIHLLFSANRWEASKSIEASLASGTTVICDRYVYSGMVYSAAKRNPALSLAWARECDVGLPRPDVVVFLDLDAAEAERRGGYGDEKYEKMEMQVEVRRLFKVLRERGEEEREDMVVVDAGTGVGLVGSLVLAAVEKKLETLEDGVLGRQVRRIGRWRQGVEEAVA